MLFSTENSSGLFFFTKHYCFVEGVSILKEIHAQLSTAAAVCFETLKLILRHCAYITVRHKVRGLLYMYVMNTYGRWCVYFRVFLTWALSESERSASRPDRFTLSVTHPPVSRVGSTASLTLQRAVKKRKISCAFLVSNPDSSAVQPVIHLN